MRAGHSGRRAGLSGGWRSHPGASLRARGDLDSGRTGRSGAICRLYGGRSGQRAGHAPFRADSPALPRAVLQAGCEEVPGSGRGGPTQAGRGPGSEAASLAGGAEGAAAPSSRADSDQGRGNHSGGARRGGVDHEESGAADRVRPTGDAAHDRSSAARPRRQTGRISAGRAAREDYRRSGAARRAHFPCASEPSARHPSCWPQYKMWRRSIPAGGRC